MVGPIVAVAVGAAVAVIAILVIFYLRVLGRGRRLGTPGVVQRSHLRCPKCQREFDFDFIPGASFSAVRLGKERYMACPLCGKWSRFNLSDTMIARPGPGTAGPPPPLPPSRPT